MAWRRTVKTKVGKRRKHLWQRLPQTSFSKKGPAPLKLVEKRMLPPEGGGCSTAARARWTAPFIFGTAGGGTGKRLSAVGTGTQAVLAAYRMQQARPPPQPRNP